MFSPIKNVIIIGASGNIGPSIISALLAQDFTVSVLTRESSNSTFPTTATVHKTDYTLPSLIRAFTNQDAVISCIATFSASLQSAITAGIKRFIPSEYGIDASQNEVIDFVHLVRRSER
jgi:putative NADH-flavin reductase